MTRRCASPTASQSRCRRSSARPSNARRSMPRPVACIRTMPAPCSRRNRAASTTAWSATCWATWPSLPTPTCSWAKTAWYSRRCRTAPSSTASPGSASSSSCARPACRWSRRCCAIPTSRPPTKSSPPAMPPRCCRSPASASAHCSPVRFIVRRGSFIGPLRITPESWLDLRMKRALVFLLLLAAASQVCAEDDAVQRVYAAMEPRIRGEYEFHLAGVARQVLGSGAPASKIELFQKRLKLLAYNRAVLVAYCIADAERDRPPNARPIPMEQNLVLTTCVDDKVGQLQKFSQLAAYADFFFPDRIEFCGERSRSPEHEQMLRPYGFLLLD